DAAARRRELVDAGVDEDGAADPPGAATGDGGDRARLTTSRAGAACVRGAGPRVSSLLALARSGADRPEQAVALVVRARGEEERVGRAVLAMAEPELERPEAVDLDRLSVRLAEHPFARERPVRLRRVGDDPAVAEVADEQVAAEPAEVDRRERQAPGSVQEVVAADAHQKPTARVVLVDEAEAGAGDL